MKLKVLMVQPTVETCESGGIGSRHKIKMSISCSAHGLSQGNNGHSVKTKYNLSVVFFYFINSLPPLCNPHHSIICARSSKDTSHMPLAESGSS